jgi:hypothetical protein
MDLVFGDTGLALELASRRVAASASPMTSSTWACALFTGWLTGPPDLTSGQDKDCDGDETWSLNAFAESEDLP